MQQTATIAARAKGFKPARDSADLAPGTWRCAGVAYGFKPDESGLPAHTLTTQRRAANTLNRLNPSPDRRRAAGLKKRNMAGRWKEHA